MLAARLGYVCVRAPSDLVDVNDFWCIVQNRITFTSQLNPIARAHSRLIDLFHYYQEITCDFQPITHTRHFSATIYSVFFCLLCFINMPYVHMFYVFAVALFPLCWFPTCVAGLRAENFTFITCTRGFCTRHAHTERVDRSQCTTMAGAFVRFKGMMGASVIYVNSR